MKKYKSLKTKKAELYGVLSYKRDKQEFDADYYELMVEYMDLLDEIELFNIIEYVISLFKKEEKES